LFDVFLLEITRKDFDFKKLRADIGGCRDLVATFQNPKKKSGITPSSSAGLVSSPTTINIVPKVICLERSSDHVSLQTSTLTPIAPSSPKPSLICDLPLPGVISRVGGTTMRLDHLSTTALDSNSYWHVNMRGKNLHSASIFPSTYDAELMTTIGGEDCFDAGEVMLGRCMAIFQHFKVTTRSHSDLFSKNVGLEKQVQELLKEKSKRDLAFAAKELELSQCQGLNRRLDAVIRHLKERLDSSKKKLQYMEIQLSKGEAEWEDENFQLQKAYVDAYEEGFMKAVRQALVFSPNLQVSQFDLDKDVVDGQLVD